MNTASADRIAASPPRPAPPPPPPPAPSRVSGREVVDRNTQGDKTDVKAVAQDLRNEIRQRPTEATKLTKEALEQVKADDRDELAQEFVRAHSDSELKALGSTAAGKGALALSVNELTKGKVHKDEADDARRVGTALGTEIDVKVNAGWSWERASGAVHTVLDIAGFIPGLGAIPDLINAGIYAAEGDKLNAGLSLGAAVPIVGDAAKGTSMVVKGGKEVLEAGAKKAVREGAEAAGEKVVKEGLEAAGKHGDEVAAKASGKTDDAAAAAAKSADAVRIGKGFDSLAARRAELGLPPAGAANDSATLSRLEVGGKSFDGINSGLQNPKADIRLDRVNAQTKTHAEGEAVQHAVDAGLAGKSKRAEMWVDRDPCSSCGKYGGLRSLARNLGVEELVVHSPSGTQVFKPTP